MDIDLVRSAMRGDERAFTEIVNLVTDRFIGVAHRILRDPVLAEDAVRQALLSAWRDLPDLRDPERFDGWSYRLLVHACYMEARKRKRWHPTTIVRSIAEPAAPDLIGGIIERERLERGFERLSVDHRAVLVLTSMLSPAKAIGAGALVLVLGGAFLIAQPFDQQGSVPGAGSEAIAPTWITGHVQPAPSCSEPPPQVDDGVIRRRNVECGPQSWTSSDPRLTGAVTRRWNGDTYETDEGPITIDMDAAYLRNDDGGWACSTSYLSRGSGTYGEALTATLTCAGSGGYEGLSAVLVSQSAAGFSEEFVGLIFPGDLPPVPGPPANE